MRGTYTSEHAVGTPSASEYTTKFWGRGAPRTSNGKCPVVFCHGFYLATPAARSEAPWVGPYAAAGHPTISSELGGGSTWGNATARARFLTQVSHMGSAHGTRTDKYGVAAESMGTILTLRMMWDSPTPQAALMAGVVLRAPVFDVEAFHTRNPSFQGAIEAAHGGTSAWNSVKASMNASTPANRAVVQTVASRLIVVYALSDELIPAAEVVSYCDLIGVPVANRFPVVGTHATIQNSPPGGITAALLHALMRRNS